MEVIKKIEAVTEAVKIPQYLDEDLGEMVDVDFEDNTFKREIENTDFWNTLKSKLKPRDYKIAHMLAEGYQNQEAGKLVGLSRDISPTIERIRESIEGKKPKVRRLVEPTILNGETCPICAKELYGKQRFCSINCKRINLYGNFTCQVCK